MNKSFTLLAAALLLMAAHPVHAQTQVPQTAQQIAFSFAPLVKQVAPAVVNIYAQRKVQQPSLSPLFDDPFFRHFFQGGMPPGMSRQRLEESLGSGVIVRPQGLIVTSNHVIRGADQIRVVLADGREFPAKLVLADSRSDLAVLRIDTKGESLPYLQLRDSDQAQVGDLVLAIGDPFGVGQTVTNGIISATARSAAGINNLNYFIQTDAAINPGNSGGALVTMDGKLVGINTAIYSQDGGNLGIGFAVPSNMVRVVLNAVAAGDKALVPPWTGIKGQDVTPDIAASLGMGQPRGLLVDKIYPDSPAATAGVRVGDVIVSVNGRAVEDPESFRYRIATLPLGSSAELGVMRKGVRFVAAVHLIAPPGGNGDETRITGENPLAGATIADLSPAVIDKANLATDAAHGVVVVKVEDGSAAANLGVEADDIIERVNGAGAASVADVMKAVRRRSSTWRITLRRGDSVVNVMVSG
ncbi:MAG TPA: Do family serine endopeptidase [Alphaproteobacteria bacterium]|nr:Do family serine endopeptidase [Alphaproteobacteria bacterium]